MEITWKIIDLDVENAKMDDPRVKKMIRKFKILKFFGIIFDMEVTENLRGKVHIWIKCWKPFNKLVWKTLMTC